MHSVWDRIVLPQLCSNCKAMAKQWRSNGEDSRFGIENRKIVFEDNFADEASIIAGCEGSKDANVEFVR